MNRSLIAILAAILFMQTALPLASRLLGGFQYWGLGFVSAALYAAAGASVAPRHSWPVSLLVGAGVALFEVASWALLATRIDPAAGSEEVQYVSVVVLVGALVAAGGGLLGLVGRAGSLLVRRSRRRDV